MNPRLIANQAVNSFRSMGRDVRSTFTGDGKDLTYAFRTPEARAAYDKLPLDQRAGHKWDRGSFNRRRAAAAAGAAYVGGDATYRILSGGSAYRNSSGESDVVGIPMI